MRNEATTRQPIGELGVGTWVIDGGERYEVLAHIEDGRTIVRRRVRSWRGPEEFIWSAQPVALAQAAL
jgi:hypothetical protein